MDSVPVQLVRLNRFLRVTFDVIVPLGLMWWMYAAGVPVSEIGGWVLLALALILICEFEIRRQRDNGIHLAYLAHRRFRLRFEGPPPPEAELELDIEGVEADSRNFHREIRLRLIAFALLIASAFGASWARPRGAGNAGISSECLQTINRGADACKKDCTCDAGPQAASGETTIRFSTDLEAALAAYLGRTPGPPPVPPSTGWGISWGFVILVGVIVVIAIIAMVHRPSTAPVVGAGGLAEEIIRNFDKFSGTGGEHSLWTILLFVFGFIVLLLAVIRIARSDKQGHAGDDGTSGEPGIDEPLGRHVRAWLISFFHKTSKESGGNALINVGFSLLLLGCAMALVNERPKAQPPGTPQVTVTQPGPVPGPHAVQNLTAELIEPSISFARGDTQNPKRMDEFKSKISVPHQNGDWLLLVGSADCTRPRGAMTNDGYAADRAAAVGGQLKGVKNLDLPIYSIALRQAQRCVKQDDLVAVFPYLIHPGNAAVSPEANKPTANQ